MSETTKLTKPIPSIKTHTVQVSITTFEHLSNVRSSIPELKTFILTKTVTDRTMIFTIKIT